MRLSCAFHVRPPSSLRRMTPPRPTTQPSSLLTNFTLKSVVRTRGGADVTVYAQNSGGPALETLGPGREVVLAWDPPHTFVVAKEAESVE